MLARQSWSNIESIHAVTYFATESVEAATASGLRGFWMGYFGFRACPLGRVGPGVVEALFANFAPHMIRRAIPDAWSLADPSNLVLARARAAGVALRRISPQIERAAADLNEMLDAVVASAMTIGRPLFAANMDIARFEDPVEQLWQNCTTLREHRGDGHVAALASAGVTGLEAHLLIAAEHGWPPSVFVDNRGWSDHHVHATRAQLVARRLLDQSGLTADGASLRSLVEATTDERAGEPFDRALGHDRWNELVTRLAPVASDVVRSNIIPFPNPMGLPSPDRTHD